MDHWGASPSHGFPGGHPLKGGGLVDLAKNIFKTALRLWHGYCWLLLPRFTKRMGSKNQSKGDWEDTQNDHKRKELKVMNKESVVVENIESLRRNQALHAGDVGKWLDTTHCGAQVIRLNLPERCL